MEIKYRSQQESGFALLMALIVVGVLVSIGLSVLELSIKQIQLSSNARDSEIAFHAANAGMECARYWRRQNADDMENGRSFTPNCFGSTAQLIVNIVDPIPNADLSGDGEAFLYQYSFTWGVDNDRCTEVTTLVASSSLPGTGLDILNVTTYIPGYPGDSAGNDEKNCEPGARCTIMSVRGYNRPCGEIGNYGTVQREVLLQF